ncbi:carboxypeptidase regulatory-like domain-containing protein [Terriglobus sp.]|uniref:TonB-dependent receptor n=1 Tax=Terriglobus sp. TaxID=1889013 RepID=UPI003B00FF1E
MFVPYRPFTKKGLLTSGRAALLASAAVVAFAPAAHAQFRASITGTVTDPTGAIVPGAQVTLLDNQTGKTLTSTSNGSGVYNFNALPPDSFTLSATMAGFSTKTINNLTITPEQANNINVELSVNATNTTVEVNADAVSPLETATASISGTITAEQIQHLPTAGHDIFQLAQLAPGSFGDAQRSGNGSTNNLPGQQGPGGSSNSSGIFATENGPQAIANGGQYETNGISIDGINTTSAVWGGTTVITPNADSVDNLKITSNGYDAEFGRFSGANLQVTTKSGTNQVHGSAFFRVTRPGLNAFNRYNGPNSALPFTLGAGVANNNVNRAVAHGLVRDTARYNDIGGSIGGPILKNRIFAFFAYETIRNSTDTTTNGTYTTTAFENAAPSGYISNRYNTITGRNIIGATPLTTTCASIGIAEGPYCHTVSGGVDVGSPLRTARGTLDPSYVSNTQPGIGGGLDGVADLITYQTASPFSATQTQYNGRMDADVTQKDHLAFAIYWQPQSQNSINGASRAYNTYHHNQINEALSLIYNRTFSPSFLNEARVNAAGWRWNELTDNPQVPFGLTQTAINAPGGSNFQQFGTPGPSHLNQWTFGYKDVATKIIRTHTIKFGGDATQLHYLQDALYAARPTFTFSNIWTFLNDAPYSESGQFSRFTGVPFSNRYDMREWITGAFVQDDWKATQNLTFNIGVRYNYFDSLYSKQNNLPHVVLGSGVNTFTGLQLVRGGNSWVPQKGNFGPQLGFAYNPDLFNKRFVLRGGYGLNYNQFEIALTANQSNNPNDAVTPNFVGTPLAADSRVQYNLPSDLSQIFGFAANSNTVTNYGANGLPTSTGLRLTTVPYHTKTQQVHHYSMEVQGDLGHQIVASATYQGSTARHLVYHEDLYTRGAYLGYAFNPQTNYIENFGDNGQSNYNALIVDLKHNMSHNFSLDASYVWSKSMDDNSGPYTMDPYSYNPIYLRARSDFNVNNALKIYGLYTPKFYYGANRFAKVALNGFNISGIYNLHSGFPWTPTVNYNTDAFYVGSGYGTLRPTAYLGGAGGDRSNRAYIGSGLSPNFSRGGRTYFNAYTSAQLRPSTFPNLPNFYPIPGVGRNSQVGPRYSSLDATVTKSFGLPNRYLGERTGFEFRVDTFNVLNQTNPSPNVDSNIDSGHFGISQAGLAGRQVQLQARISF